MNHPLFLHMFSFLSARIRLSSGHKQIRLLLPQPLAHFLGYNCPIQLAVPEQTMNRSRKSRYSIRHSGMYTDCFGSCKMIYRCIPLHYWQFLPLPRYLKIFFAPTTILYFRLEGNISKMINFQPCSISISCFISDVTTVINKEHIRLPNTNYPLFRIKRGYIFSDCRIIDSIN